LKTAYEYRGQQLGLFESKDAPLLDCKPHLDLEALQSWALLYTATEAGNNSGIRFAMTIEDAKAWCSSDLSKGVLHGTRWAYFWTSIVNFIECHGGPQSGSLSIAGIVDNGEWDERIGALGLKIVHHGQFGQTFGPMGLEITT
jgi:hypothetical protein